MLDDRSRHKIEYHRRDGTTQTVTIIGASDTQLRDDAFIVGLVDQYCTPDVRGECVVTLRTEGD